MRWHNVTSINIFSFCCNIFFIYFKEFEIHKKFRLKFEYQGEEKFVDIDNLKRTLNDYIVSSWPEIENNKNLAFVYDGKPINTFESIKALDLKSSDKISIIGIIFFS